MAGYVKGAGGLTFAIVRNAGHLVPADQPAWALEMIDSWINERSPFDPQPLLADGGDAGGVAATGRRPARDKMLRGTRVGDGDDAAAIVNA